MTEKRTYADRREYMRAWRTRTGYQKKYYAAHSEALRESQRAYRLRNLKSVSARIARWKRENPDRVAVLFHRRRARVHNAPVNDLTPAQWRQILAEWKCCTYCGATDRKLTQDHVVPISRGGSHTAANVVPACQPCNSKKGTKTVEVFCGVEAA